MEFELEEQVERETNVISLHKGESKELSPLEFFKERYEGKVGELKEFGKLIDKSKEIDFMLKYFKNEEYISYNQLDFIFDNLELLKNQDLEKLTTLDFYKLNYEDLSKSNLKNFATNLAGGFEMDFMLDYFKDDLTETQADFIFGWVDVLKKMDSLVYDAVGDHEFFKENASPKLERTLEEELSEMPAIVETSKLKDPLITNKYFKKAYGTMAGIVKGIMALAMPNRVQRMAGYDDKKINRNNILGLLAEISLGVYMTFTGMDCAQYVVLDSLMRALPQGLSLNLNGKIDVESRLTCGPVSFEMLSGLGYLAEYVRDDISNKLKSRKLKKDYLENTFGDYVALVKNYSKEDLKKVQKESRDYEITQRIPIKDYFIEKVLK